MPSNAAEEVAHVAQELGAGEPLEQPEMTVLLPGVQHPPAEAGAAARAGRSSSRSARPSMKRVMRAGDVEEVERVLRRAGCRARSRRTGPRRPARAAARPPCTPGAGHGARTGGGRCGSPGSARAPRRRAPPGRPAGRRSPWRRAGAPTARRPPARPSRARGAPASARPCHAEGGREAPGGVDGDHHHAGARRAPAAGATRGRDGRLADAAGAAADHQPPVLEVRRSRAPVGAPTAAARAAASISSASRSNRRRTSSGSSSTGRPVPSARRSR